MNKLFSEDSLLSSAKVKQHKKIAIVGLYIAVFVNTFVGVCNDIISAKYLPIEFGGDSATFGLTFKTKGE